MKSMCFRSIGLKELININWNRPDRDQIEDSMLENVIKIEKINED